MKPITFLFEIDLDSYGQSFLEYITPGWHKARFGGVYFNRIWWLCFGFTWVRMNLYDYNQHLRSGKSQWKIPASKIKIV
jgi:hypothetical protein